MAKILLVDDEPSMHHWVDYLRDDEGHDVTWAQTGEEGLEKLAEEPDLVLLDYNMPGINGHQFAQRVRNDERYKDIPLVGTGSFPHFEQEELNEMLPKAWTIEGMVECISRYS